MMPEGYAGTKFRTIFASGQSPQDERLDELVNWSHRLARLGVLATAMGNVSFRSPGGFVISPTGTDPLTIIGAQFVEVLKVDVVARELTVRGALEPSSESMLHGAIYQARPDVHAVFHGHAARVLDHADRLGIAVTVREQPYGTPALVDEALALVGEHDLFVMRNHGFVALGATLAEAGQRIAQLLEKI